MIKKCITKLSRYTYKFEVYQTDRCCSYNGVCGGFLIEIPLTVLLQRGSLQLVSMHARLIEAFLTWLACWYFLYFTEFMTDKTMTTTSRYLYCTPRAFHFHWTPSANQLLQLFANSGRNCMTMPKPSPSHHLVGASMHGQWSSWALLLIMPAGSRIHSHGSSSPSLSPRSHRQTRCPQPCRGHS
jgi:hypothetical protein